MPKWPIKCDSAIAAMNCKRGCASIPPPLPSPHPHSSMHSDEAVIPMVPMVVLAIPDSCPVAVPLHRWPTGAWGVVLPSPLDGSLGSHVMERGTSSTVKQSECLGTGQVGGAKWVGPGGWGQVGGARRMGPSGWGQVGGGKWVGPGGWGLGQSWHLVIWYLWTCCMCWYLQTFLSRLSRPVIGNR